MIKNKKSKLLLYRKVLELLFDNSLDYNKTVELRENIDNDVNWCLISHSYSVIKNDMTSFQEECVYYNKELNKGVDIVVNDNYKLGYVKYFNEDKFYKYHVYKKSK